MTDVASGRARLADRYTLLEAIGRGGMGAVWRARDDLLGRLVAVKEISPPAGLTQSEQRTLRERTLREARAAARISSRSAVTVYDVVDQDDRPWIVMELLEARSLAEVLREDGPLTPQEAAGIGLAVLDALEAAHRAGVVHRDVKPANVLLCTDGRVVLTDFGIAALDGDPTLTQTGTVLGSPAYMAPERAHGEQPTPAMDMWSLGVTLYAAVEGRSPFQREGSFATLHAVLTVDAPRPTRGGRLARVIEGLLVRDPARRLDAARARAMLVDAQRPEPGGDTTVRLPPPVLPVETPSVERAIPVVPLPETRPLGAATTPVPVARTSPLEPPTTAYAPGPPGPRATPGPAGSGPAGSRATEPPASTTAVVPVVSEPPRPRVGPARRTRVPFVLLLAMLLLGAAAWYGGQRIADRRSLPATAGTAVTSTTGAGPRATTAAARPSVSRSSSPRPPTRTPATATAAAPVPPTSPSPSPSASPSVSPSASPSPSRSTSPAATSSPSEESTPAGGPAPGGFQRFTDPTGFSVAVPEGWVRSRSGRQVYFRDPDSSAFLQVDQTDSPEGDVLVDWQSKEPGVAQRREGYQRIAIRRVDYRGWEAADWDFTWRSDGGTRVRVRNRNVITAPGEQAYALYYSAPVQRWDEGLFDAIARSFRPREG